ncbi:MAG TPA: MFS transporter [Chloroflexota bacterium]|nr:MFS transporter [Chloroflexota bacterium]
MAISAALAGVFLAAIDQTVVLTAIPEMLQDVRVGLTQLDQASWIVTGYLLGYVSVLPLMGRLSDVYGRRSVFVAALAVFAAGSCACALATSLWWLVAARVCQAIGGGALLPVTFAFLADRVPAPKLPFWLGAAGAAAEAGGVLGPLYGAAIVEHLGWRWIFWINLPLALLIGMAFARSTVSPFALGVTTRRAVDYAGAALFALALAALTVGLSGSSDPTRSASPIELRRAIPLTAIALLALAAFIWRERRAVEPLLPLSLFRVRAFWAANAANALVGVALIAAMVDVPLFAATVLGRAPIDAGLALLRLTVCIPIGALAGGWLAGRLRWDIVALAGLLLAAAGFFLMHGWTLDVSDAGMTPGLVVAGLGFGLVIAPITSAVLSGAGAADRALSTALVTALRMTGMTVGLAALTSVAFFRFNQLVRGLALPLPSAGQSAAEAAQRLAAYEAGITRAGLEVFTEVFLIAGAVCLAAGAFALLLGRGRMG